MSKKPQTIAVIGSGISGLTATHILQRKHRVTLFEKEAMLGGHTHTELIPEGPDQGMPVDTGFIVMNHRNYPLFTRLLEQLNVPLQDSDMSFSYHDASSGLQYSGSGLNGLLAQRKNLINPTFLRMMRDVFNFFRFAEADLQQGNLAEESLGDYLKRRGLGQAFIDHHIIPMGSAIWSTPCEEMLRFPAQSFLQFFQNHGLLTINDRPQWKTVVGGSHSYIKQMREQWKDNVEISLNASVESVARANNTVEVHFNHQPTRTFDQVIIATHADQAYQLLKDPSPEETESLGCWEYSNSRTILHTDKSVMPPLQRVWSSWNFTRLKDQRTCLTYDMNRLQSLNTDRNYFVSLNLPTPPQGIIREYNYTHPMFTQQALAQRPQLNRINGVRNTWFAGSYFGNGFHEDGVRSGVQVARGLGMEL